MEIEITLTGSSGVVDGKVDFATIADLFKDRVPFLLIRHRLHGEIIVNKSNIATIKRKR